MNNGRSGEGLISPSPMQVSYPPTHSSCYATPIITDKCTFFKSSFGVVSEHTAVWGVYLAPFFRLGGPWQPNGGGRSPVPSGPYTAE